LGPEERKPPRDDDNTRGGQTRNRWGVAMSKDEDSTDTNARAMQHLAEALKLSKAVASRAHMSTRLRHAKRGLVETTLELRRLNDATSKRG